LTLHNVLLGGDYGSNIKYLLVIPLLMRVEGLEFDIPSLDYNPFSTSPLEVNQGNLYVGRLDIRGRISQHINFKSNRRILMVGELGSGRTSLLRCAGKEAAVYVHIDHISASDPDVSLLQRMYSELVGYQIPGNTVEMVNKMVEFSRSFENKLPLIVIDTPNVEGSVLSVALRDVLPALERLQAVVVVVVEPKQRTSIPDSVMNGFANIENLSSLSINEVQELIERRINSVSNEDFSMSLSDATIIHNKTSGTPIEVVKAMRDSIDDMMMSSNGLLSESPESSEKYHFEDIIETDLDDNMQSVEKSDDSDIIDASIPWNERIESENIDHADGVKDLFGFELDLEELSESKSFDEPVEEHTFSAIPDTGEIIDASAFRRPSIDAGAFGGLLGRTRDFKERDKSISPDMVNELNLQGAELWTSKDLLEPEEKIEFSEDESAELIHDEIGIAFENEEESSSDDTFNNVVYENDSNNEKQSVSQILRLLNQLFRVNNNTSSGDSQEFISSLLKLSEDRYSDKTDYTLNAAVLSSLNVSESYVVSIAKDRKYSPSDKDMLKHLEIKRPRLSQISNRLLKSGILNVRIKGRSRYFELTQDARAQLIAWGLIGGVE